MQKPENPDLILRHMLEEWKYLNDYIIKMDNNFGTGGDADKKLDRLREKAQLVPVLKRTHPA